MREERTICYTLDLEHDYAGVAPTETYDTFSRCASLNRLADIVQRYGLKLTVFATGKVLEHKRDSVEFFRRLGAEIELHGYYHVMQEPDFTLEVQKGLNAYREYFGKDPLGYRSPGGVMSNGLLETLVEAGIKYDSSLMPSFRWGVYSNLTSQLGPYFHQGVPLLELPMGVIPKVRFPVATSYIRILGLFAYKVLFGLCGRPSPLVYLFHLVDLIPVGMRKQLTPFLRCAYVRGDGKGLEIFEASVKYFEAAGYRSEYMSDLYEKYAGGSPSQLSSRG
jgi:hypothetical protein